MCLQRKSLAYIRRIFRMTLHYERCTKTFRCQTKNVARSDPNVGRSEREDVTLWNGTSVHVTVFWEVTPYSVAKVYWCSGVNYHHHRPTFFSARRWKQNDHPNRRHICTRIEKKIEDVLIEDQFGFRREKGTRDTIRMLRITSERTLEIDEELCFCFIDWQKAFDRVNCTKLTLWRRNYFF